MKILKVKFYIGLDAHKQFTVVAVRDLDGNLVFESSCASRSADLKAVLEPYLFSCVMGLECNTESYPLYDGLKGEYDIRVANTIQLRTLVGKNDKLDAKRLADMLRLNSFPCAFIAEGKQRTLREIVKVRHNLLEQSIRLQLQLKAFSRKQGIVLSPGKGISVRSLKLFQLYLADNPYEASLRFLLDQYDYTKKKLEQLTKEMCAYVKTNFGKQFNALTSIRGIGEVLASYLISEICPITRFQSVKKLRRYAGVIACSEQSAGKTYSTHLPKATSRAILRWAFVEAANCMNKHHEGIKAYYKKKKKEKKIHGKAIMPVARSICDMVFKTLKACEVGTT